jgi:hypothetical protein
MFWFLSLQHQCDAAAGFIFRKNFAGISRLTWAHEPSVDLGLASHGSARLLSETGRVCGEQAEWYPVALFLKDGNGEILGGLLGDIWPA